MDASDFDQIFFQTVVAVLSIVFMLAICCFKSKAEERQLQIRKSSHVAKQRLKQQVAWEEVLKKLIRPLQKQTKSPSQLDNGTTPSSPPDLKPEPNQQIEHVNSATLCRYISKEEQKYDQNPLQYEICREIRSNSTLRSSKWSGTKTNINKFHEKPNFKNCFFAVHVRNSGKPRNSIRTVNDKKSCEISVKRDTNSSFILFSKIAVKYKKRVSLLKLCFGHVAKRRNSQPVELFEKSFHSHRPVPKCVEPTMDIMFLEQLIQMRYLPTRMFKPVLSTLYEVLEEEECSETEDN